MEIDVASLPSASGRNFSRRQTEPLKCGAKDSLASGEWIMIESKNYPNKYPNRQNCRWTLTVPKDAIVILSCEYFDVKKGDFFAIGNNKLHGTREYGFFYYPFMMGRTLSLRFRSNKKTTGGGFRYN